MQYNNKSKFALGQQQLQQQQLSKWISIKNDDWRQNKKQTEKTKKNNAKKEVKKNQTNIYC